MLGIFVLLACGRYEPIPWRDLPGRISSVSDLGKKMVFALEGEIKRNRVRLFSQHTGRPAAQNKNLSLVSLNLIIAGFPDVRSGFRTQLSEKIENSIRGALKKSRVFNIVDGGDGISWQEAEVKFSMEVSSGKGNFPGQKGEKATPPRGSPRIKPVPKWGDDHPVRGIWKRIRMGRYSERSAVYAASMLGADAAVYGAYEKKADRILVWGAVVMNRPSRKLVFERELKNSFGLPDRLTVSRPYLGYIRGNLDPKWVPDFWLTTKVPPRPRDRPRYFRYWANPAFEVVLEKIDSKGSRVRLSGGEIIGSKDLIVGRIGVLSPRVIYGFSLDRYGRVGSVFFSGRENGKPILVRPGNVVHFSARLHPPGRAYRMYFVSAPLKFDVRKVQNKASIRLGIRGGQTTAAQNYRDAAKGYPERAWFVPAGQEYMILEKGWGQLAFWLHRESSD